jgi:hypothetical protein
MIEHRLSGSGFNVPGWKSLKQLAAILQTEPENSDLVQKTGFSM